MVTQAGTAVERQHLLLARLTQARAITDRLFDVVRTDALYDRPIPERHRIVFYIGHLETFDHNLLAPRLRLHAFHPEFDRLFAFGIDPVGGGLPQDQPADWPRLEEVRGYARRLRERLDERLGRAARDPDGRQLLHVAVEHRLMHAETLAYMFHQLPLHQKVAQPEPVTAEGPAPLLRRIEIPAGTATLGAPRPSGSPDGFGWDNEFEAQQVEVPAFSIDAYNVTNGQYLEFVRAGGYEEPAHWAAAAWDWIRSQGIRHPRFWTNREGEWRYRAMFDERPLPLAWPVYVSHAEAAAYARWAGKALPTEAQFHRAAYGTPASSESVERHYPWGNEPPDERRGNFDFRHWNQVAVGSHPEGCSAFGVEDLVGNGWEWTSTRFAPFPGFKAFPFYPGYSANFFEGKHYVLKGGSARTAALLLRRSFRNWFQPHYPFVYAGFRLVEN
jgi:ergothioneine biosynthesis protein EgtB